MLRLHLLAHAPTPAQRLAQFPSDEGIEAVDPAAAARLATRVGPCRVIWRGPGRRAAETAEALGLSATVCDDLRAWSAGAWTGLTIGWVAEHDPDGFRAWQTDPSATPGGGESLHALLARVAGWTEAHASESGRALVIADPAVIRGIVVHVLAAAPETFWRLEVPPLSLSVVQYAQGQWRLRHLVLEGLAE